MENLVEKIENAPEEGCLQAILPEDHPLLERFQQNLKNHLLRIQEQLQNEISVLDHSLKVKSEERQEVGAALYDLQQQIGQQRQALEEYEVKIQDVSEKRQEVAAKCQTLRRECQEKEGELREAKTIHAQRLMELDNLTVLENNMSKWAKEAKDEVTVAKRVASKDTRDRQAKMEEGQKMELFLYHLDTDVRKRENELNTINEQIREQEITIEMLNKSLVDSNADLEILQQEQKRMTQTWGEVIVAIQQRDKVLSMVQNDLNLEYRRQKEVRGFIEATNKAIQKQIVHNHKLSVFRNRLQGDVKALEKQLIREDKDYERLYEKISEKSSILDQTETDLKQAKIEGILLESQLKGVSAKIEKQATRKVELEEKILELLQNQITADKVGQYRARDLREIQEKRRNAEIMLSNTENQLSILLLDLEKYRGIVGNHHQVLEKLQRKEKEMKMEANKQEDEMKDVLNSIESRQRRLDVLTKQLNEKISASGGREGNPDELKLLNLQGEIEDLDGELKKVQNFWLRLQGHVMNLTEKRSQQTNEIFLARKQFLIIDQKCRKVERELQRLVEEDRMSDREIGKLHSRLELLSGRLFEEQKDHDQQEEECFLNHQAHTAKLKEAELSILQLEREIEELEGEIEETKDLVIEKHREALAWETKYRLAVETKKSSDMEASAESETGHMRAEIHRMEVRYAQLRKAQEKLMQDMDNCINHRENIFNQASVKEKLHGGKAKVKSTVQQKLSEMHIKMKQVNGEISVMERSLCGNQQQQEHLEQEIAKKCQELEAEQHQNALIEQEIGEGMLLKHDNLETIVRKQHRARRFKALATGRVPPKCRPEGVIEQSMKKQREVQEHLTNLMENLLTDFPHHKFPLTKIIQTLKNN
ncbi:coiled-coil domain-containing protein 40 [Lutzomyia longipalpis]|uniref:coiled-coil domain-containing protein 40 n=1 Tax=Lutzomyia longipalpis TaxID=7200 RepID=UPI0024843968|nr:coiled-coil domain-containing protein 40 [Lutzomyia longipalpis]